MSEKTWVKGITVELTEDEAFASFAAMTLALGHMTHEGNEKLGFILDQIRDNEPDFHSAIAKFSAIADRCIAARREGISSL